MRESILTEVKEMIRAAFVDFQTTVLKPMLHEITNELKQSVRELTAQPLLSKSSSSSSLVARATPTSAPSLTISERAHPYVRPAQLQNDGSSNANAQ